MEAASHGAHCIVIRGEGAGGIDQDFTSAELKSKQPLRDLIPETLDGIKKIWEGRNPTERPILLAAGGITTGEDIVRYLNLGAEGVVMVNIYIYFF